MRTPATPVTIRLAAAALMAAALTACGKPVATEDPAATPPASTTGEAPAPATPAPPTPESPPPTEPPPEAAPATAAVEPPLESMTLAKRPAKLSVPVDLRYSFDTAPLTNQPAMLHLAAVPRVPGTNLSVSIKAVDGIQVAAAGNLNAQKASANSAYRQRYSVTRQSGAPSELRVLVTMDLPSGSGFGFFSIPFEPGPASQKQESVKQR